MTPPLVPPYVNLRMFDKMPLAVQRLRDSALASTPSPEAFRCSILLFCSSWHQVPAGSIPGDEKELAKLAGFGRSVREWRKVSQETLRNWLKCDDGRYYHPVVADEAKTAWAAHLKHGWRCECERLKKSSQRMGLAAVFPKFDEWTDRYQTTGVTRWDEILVPRDVPGDIPPCPPEIPRDSGTKGKEGKGRDSKSSIDTSPHAEGIRSLAVDLARAAIAIGFEACSAGAPEITRAAEVGITVDELKHAAIGMKAGKGLAYLVQRAIGKRADAQQIGAGGSSPGPQADPDATKAAAARHDIDRERSLIHGDRDNGLFDDLQTRALLETLQAAGVDAVRRQRREFRAGGGVS